MAPGVAASGCTRPIRAPSDAFTTGRDASWNCRTAWVQAQHPTRGDCAPQGTVSSVWRHSGLPRLGGAHGISWVNTRDAANVPRCTGCPTTDAGPAQMSLEPSVRGPGLEPQSTFVPLCGHCQSDTRSRKAGLSPGHRQLRAEAKPHVSQFPRLLCSFLLLIFAFPLLFLCY